MKAFPIFVVLGAAGLFVAHYLAFVYAPMEVEMRAIQRIFYFHVPSAWMCYLGFLICSGASVAYLWTRKAKYDAVALAAGEVGLVFGVVVLVTGPLWARGAWGVWWRWEPRLTSMMLLFLMFAAYWVLRTFGGQSSGVRRFAAILSIFGAPNIFFVHYAVAKWGGVHPPTPSITPEMRVALYSTLAVVMVVFFLLLRLRFRMHRDMLVVRSIRRRINRMRSA